MAVSALVEKADVKELLSIEASVTRHDDWIDAAIEAVSASFQGAIGQASLLDANYSETYDGNDRPVLFVKARPVTAVNSVAIEDESAIDATDDDEFRFKPNGEFWLRGGRLWTAPRFARVRNVTVDYDAGYANVAAFRDALPDAWALILQTVKQWFIDDAVDQPDRRGVSSIAHAGGAIGYFEPRTFARGEWYERTWLPVVMRHRRRRLDRG